MKYVIATIWMLAAPALAQDIDYDPAVLAMCLENAETLQDRTYCIGQGAQACTRTDAGQSTPGLSYCYGAEWGDWDGRLNAVYGTLLEQQPELAEDTRRLTVKSLMSWTTCAPCNVFGSNIATPHASGKPPNGAAAREQGPRLRIACCA